MGNEIKKTKINPLVLAGFARKVLYLYSTSRFTLNAHLTPHLASYSTSHFVSILIQMCLIPHPYPLHFVPFPRHRCPDRELYSRSKTRPIQQLRSRGQNAQNKSISGNKSITDASVVLLFLGQSTNRRTDNWYIESHACGKQ